MKNSIILPLFVLVATSPLAAAAVWPRVYCGSDGSYTANSTYEANLRHLAAVVPDEAAAAHRPDAWRVSAFGYWPNRLQAGWSCHSRGGNCAACIADAFKQVELECPFHREAFFGGDCTLHLTQYRILEVVLGMNLLAMGMIFQAFGLACIFLFFLQVWRHDIKKGTITRSTPLSGDQ